MIIKRVNQYVTPNMYPSITPLIIDDSRLTLSVDAFQFRLLIAFTFAIPSECSSRPRFSSTMTIVMTITMSMKYVIRSSLPIFFLSNFTH